MSWTRKKSAKKHLVTTNECIQRTKDDDSEYTDPEKADRWWSLNHISDNDQQYVATQMAD